MPDALPIRPSIRYGVAGTTAFFGLIFYSFSFTTNPWFTASGGLVKTCATGCFLFAIALALTLVEINRIPIPYSLLGAAGVGLILFVFAQLDRPAPQPSETVEAEPEAPELRTAEQESVLVTQVPVGYSAPLPDGYEFWVTEVFLLDDPLDLQAPMPPFPIEPEENLVISATIECTLPVSETCTIPASNFTLSASDGLDLQSFTDTQRRYYPVSSVGVGSQVLEIPSGLIARPPSLGKVPGGASAEVWLGFAIPSGAEDLILNYTSYSSNILLPAFTDPKTVEFALDIPS